MDDALMVSRALGGDLDSFGQLYDRYYGRVYDFVWRVVRDNDAAAEVTQDVFTRALQGLTAASKAASFEAWLFTIAHHAAVARAEHAGPTAALLAAHEEAFGSFDVPDPCRLDDPAVVDGDHELGALVWEAATALNPRDYALLDLHLRQGLAAAELSAIIGVSRGNAATMVSRMKTAASSVIGSYVVARRGSNDCLALQQTLAQFDFPPYTDQVRTAVDAHVAECDRCKRARAAVADPLAVFAAFAPVAAPMALTGDVWRDVARTWAASGPVAGASRGTGTVAALPPNPYATPIAARGSGGMGGGDDGLGGGAPPMPDGEGWNQKSILLFVGAAVGLLIFAFAGGALIARAFGGGGGSSGGTGGTPAAAAKSATRTTTAGPSITPGVAVQTPTPNRTPSATPVPVDTPTEEPPPTVAPPTLPPPTSTPVALHTVTPAVPTTVPPATPTPAAGATVIATATFAPP